MMFVTKVFNNNDEAYDNYQVKLPDDFYRLKWAIVDGCPALVTAGDGIDLLGNPCYTQSPVAQWQLISSSPWFVDGFGNQFGPVSGDKSYITACGVTFTINDTYIKFNQKSGNVVLLYEAFPADEDGFPLIPDVMEIKNAVAKYITMKLDYISWRFDATDTGKKAIHEHSEREYMWAIGKAHNAIKMLDYDEMELLKREHLRLIPNYNRYKQLFNKYGYNKWNT
jgi:hypothetical protein